MVTTFFATGLLANMASGSAFSATPDVWYVALGHCGEGDEAVSVSKVNQAQSSSLCLPAVDAASAADAATQAAVQNLGNGAGTELIRVEAGKASPSHVKQIFSVIAAPANPLDLPVDRLHFFQATASSCSENANFSFSTVNDKQTQRGRGERDVRVNAVYDLPADWTLERLRHEVLFEQAAFRGIVERPTFDILHPFAERPLLVTVFDLLPIVRSTDRCNVGAAE